jgi:hypothetical protein
VILLQEGKVDQLFEEITPLKVLVYLAIDEVVVSLCENQ